MHKIRLYCNLNSDTLCGILAVSLRVVVPLRGGIPVPMVRIVSGHEFQWDRLSNIHVLIL